MFTHPVIPVTLDLVIGCIQRLLILGTILLQRLTKQHLMQNKPKENDGASPDKKETGQIPLSETISNAHSSGDGAIRLAEDGLIESGETIADADANKESGSIKDEY